MKSPEAHSTPPRRAPLIAVRLCFGVVFCWNIMCALQFAITPEQYAAAYELSGVAGAVAVQGLGVAFLMWNATYPVYLARPRRYPVLGGAIIAQQVIGLIGEIAIALSLPAGHDLLFANIARFVAFDAAGLALMAASFTWLTLTERPVDTSHLSPERPS